ncbi:MAG: hypothetical protein ABIE36_01085 [Candidatus Diapherotrites archaeon]
MKNLAGVKEADSLILVEVMMPDASITPGFAETNITQLKEGSIIQFERFGFVRLIKKGKEKYEFWFLHK